MDCDPPFEVALLWQNLLACTKMYSHETLLFFGKMEAYIVMLLAWIELTTVGCGLLITYGVKYGLIDLGVGSTL